MKQKTLTSFAELKKFQEAVKNSIAELHTEEAAIKAAMEAAMGKMDSKLKLRLDEAEVIITDGDNFTVSFFLLNGKIDRICGSINIQKVSRSTSAEIINCIKF
jgi:NAD kinase